MGVPLGNAVFHRNPRAGVVASRSLGETPSLAGQRDGGPLSDRHDRHVRHSQTLNICTHLHVLNYGNSSFHKPKNSSNLGPNTDQPITRNPKITSQRRIGLIGGAFGSRPPGISVPSSSGFSRDRDVADRAALLWRARKIGHQGRDGIKARRKDI